MRVYIAGPMSGYPKFNRPAFNSMEAFQEQCGNVVLNPAILPDGLTQAMYMDICCAMIRCADAVVMLKGWEESSGAFAEHALAKKLGLEIIYQFPVNSINANRDDQDCRGSIRSGV
ncbi:DUF4406 domain-containing protein [Enterobacter roggenkampii]